MDDGGREVQREPRKREAPEKVSQDDSGEFFGDEIKLYKNGDRGEDPNLVLFINSVSSN